MKAKGMLTAVILVAAVLLLQTAGLAVDLDYSGPLNSFTGEAASENSTSRGEEWVPVSSGIYYDRENRAYVYDLGGAGGKVISANVVDGMIVSEVVWINPPQDIAVRLYRNGTLVEDVDISQIDQPGQYVLEAQLLGDQFVRVMTFTIVGATTGLINSYPMPAGFIIQDVKMAVKDENGEWVDAKPEWDRSRVSMSVDGAYQIRYECARNGLTYTLQTIIDHEPPKLALENVVNGLAKGPVDISDLEEGCRIGITLNGGKMKYTEELTLNGDYKIILQDPAGNVTNYEFTILVYFDTNSWIFFGLVLLVIGGTGVYLYVERKRMRVR